MATVKTYSYRVSEQSTYRPVSTPIEQTSYRPVPAPRGRIEQDYRRQISGQSGAAVSTHKLDYLSEKEKQRVVVDTVTAVEKGVVETANYLRRASTPREDSHDLSEDETRDLVQIYDSWSDKQQSRPVSAPPRPHDSPSAKKRASPVKAGAVRVYPESPTDDILRRQPAKAPLAEVTESNLIREFGLDWDDRARAAERPLSQSLSDVSDRAAHRRRPDSDQPPRICGFCDKPITGPCITALAANADRALRFHPDCFNCVYCLRPLNRRGTYKQHENKPYCHECSYRLFSGPIM